MKKVFKKAEIILKINGINFNVTHNLLIIKLNNLKHSNNNYESGLISL